MSGIVSAIINNMKSQGIQKIAAIVDRKNLSSIRVLEKSGFSGVKQFDIKQDYFEIC